MSLTVSAFAIENGPGPQRGTSDSSGDRRLTVLAKALGDNVAVLDPDVEQRTVPGVSRLDVVLELPDRVGTRASV
jgi:hypothetical protein